MDAPDKTLVISMKGDMYEFYSTYAEKYGDDVKIMINRAIKYYRGTLETRERRAKKQKAGESK